jgi:hypothetical protein
MSTRSTQPQHVLILTVALLVALGSWAAYAHPKPSHFKCYQLAEKDGALNEDVTLVDQFHEEDVKLNNPHFLCTPLEKKCRDGYPCEDFEESEWHLLCWKIAPSGPPVDEDVTTKGSQFEDREVKVQTGQLLCEPVEKIREKKH